MSFPRYPVFFPILTMSETVFHLSCPRYPVSFILMQMCVCVSCRFADMLCLSILMMTEIYVCVCLGCVPETMCLSVLTMTEVNVLFQLSGPRYLVPFNPDDDGNMCFSCVPDILCLSILIMTEICVCVFQVLSHKDTVFFNPDGSVNLTKLSLVRPAHYDTFR